MSTWFLTLYVVISLVIVYMECFLSQVRLAWCIGYLCWLFSWMAEVMKYFGDLEIKEFFQGSIGAA